MPVQELIARAVKSVASNEIRGVVRVYRPNQGNDGPGRVGWMPNGEVVQMQDLAAGQTVNFNIKGKAGRLANGCPATVQLIWQNTAATPATNVRENAAREFFKDSVPKPEATASTPRRKAKQNLTGKGPPSRRSNQAK